MKLLRIGEVAEKTGMAKRTIYKAAARGDFPPSRKFGGVSAWLESEIDEWILSLPTEKEATSSGDSGN